MPVVAQVAINSDILYHVHIMRMEGESMAPESVNTYSVIITDRVNDAAGQTLRPSWGDHLNDGVRFEHTYGQGALVCLSKGVDAWQAAGGNLWV